MCTVRGDLRSFQSRIVCPAHLVRQWQQELQGQGAVDIEATDAQSLMCKGENALEPSQVTDYECLTKVCKSHTKSNGHPQSSIYYTTHHQTNDLRLTVWTLRAFASLVLLMSYKCMQIPRKIQLKSSEFHLLYNRSRTMSLWNTSCSKLESGSGW